MTPEQLRECPIDQCAENTDREIYRGPDDGCGDFYSDSLHITQEGALGINCGGYVIVRPIRAWHGIAKAHAAALEELAQVRRDMQRMAEEMATKMAAPAHARANRAEAALAESERKCERLKFHAEAMAETLDKWAAIDQCKCSSVDAYRAEFKEE